jgi:hypothetical protein
MNCTFFSVTLYKIKIMKKEAQVLKRGDSMTHRGCRGESQEKERYF